jgi:hypothetical protein
VTRLKWKLVSVRLETVLISVQDRCILCAKCTIGSEVIFDTLDDILRDEAQMEARFGPFGDSVNVSAR